MGFLGKSSWILKGSTRFHVPKTWIHLGCRFVNGFSVSRFENRTFNKKTGGYGYVGRKGIKKWDELGKMVSKASYLLVCLVILYDFMLCEAFLKASWRFSVRTWLSTLSLFDSPSKKKKRGASGIPQKIIIFSIEHLFFWGGGLAICMEFPGTFIPFFLSFFCGFPALARSCWPAAFFFCFGSETCIHFVVNITLGFPNLPIRCSSKPCRGALWPEGACHQPDTEQNISSRNLQAGHILVSVGGLHRPSLGKWWAQDAFIWRGWGTWLFLVGVMAKQWMWNNVKAACLYRKDYGNIKSLVVICEGIFLKTVLHQCGYLADTKSWNPTGDGHQGCQAVSTTYMFLDLK